MDSNVSNNKLFSNACESAPAKAASLLRHQYSDSLFISVLYDFASFLGASEFW